MDLFIVLAYPIVYMHGRLRQLSKPKVHIVLANSLPFGSIPASS
jgi:hypothetical protein